MNTDLLWLPFAMPYSNITVPNRLALAPMTTYSSHPDGTVSDAEVEYLRRRAAGGIGTIITAACYVDPAGKGFIGQWGCSDDRFLPSLRRVAEAVREEGGMPLLQIHDAGRMSNPQVIEGAPRAPSPIPAARPDAVTPRAMSTTEIQASIESFAAAAKRAIQAGYYGVEIHGANTYLLQQFFSPHSNCRTDRWGGNLDKRMRFIIETVQAVRDAVGLEGVVGYRFSPEEVENPGITMDDTLELVDTLTELPLDYLHVSLGNYRQGSLRNPDDTRPRSQIVLDRVNGDKPVIVVGSITTPEQAIDALHMGAALVGLGRVALYEPDWAAKVRAGQLDELRTCLPAVDGDSICTLPPPMYATLLSRRGWVPICSK